MSEEVKETPISVEKSSNDPENQAASDDEDEDDKLVTDLNGVTLNVDAAKKKKKKKKKKKTDGTAAGAATGTTATTTIASGGGGSKPSKVQTSPPSIPICELFTDGNYPVGEIMNHPVPRDMDA